jgi:hypothetical protein
VLDRLSYTIATGKAKPEDLDTRASRVNLKSEPTRGIPISAFPESEYYDKDIAAMFKVKPPIAGWNLEFKIWNRLYPCPFARPCPKNREKCGL